MLRLVPNLRAYADPLTEAMVDFYTMSQVRKGGREGAGWGRGCLAAKFVLETKEVLILMSYL